MATDGALTFRLAEAVHVGERHAELIAGLLAARSTRPAESLAHKIEYELTFDADARAELRLGRAERFELLFVLDEVNPNRTDETLNALDRALRAVLNIPAALAA